MVTLRFGAPARTRTLPPACLDQHRVVGRRGDRRRVAVVRGAQRLGAEHLRRLRRPEPLAALGRARSRRPPATRLTVSVTGAAAITPGGVRLGGEPGDQRVDQLAGDQRPRRVVDGDDLGLAGTSASAWPTESARVSPPVTTIGWKAPGSSGRPATRRRSARARARGRAGPRSRPRSTLGARANAASDQATSGRPATSTSAFGPPAPSLSPEPAAAISAAACCAPLRPWRWRRSAPPAARRCTPRRRPRPCRGRT